MNINLCSYKILKILKIYIKIYQCKKNSYDLLIPITLYVCVVKLKKNILPVVGICCCGKFILQITLVSKVF